MKRITCVVAAVLLLSATVCGFLEKVAASAEVVFVFGMPVSFRLYVLGVLLVGFQVGVLVLIWLHDDTETSS